jgi:DNA-binding response OmpR family regulator
VVDDNADMCKLVAAILRADGFVVDWCTDADVAIENVRTHSYSAVVIEPSPAACFAPVIDYIAASREDGLHSVVFATTEDDPMVRVAGSGAVFTTLRKPLSRDSVSSAVRSCIAAA